MSNPIPTGNAGAGLGTAGPGLASFWRGMLLLGGILMCLRAANVAYVLHCSQRDGVEYYSGPDTASNILNSQALFDERPLTPIFRERIVYPFLLGMTRMAGLEYRQLLWLTVPLEIPAVLAMGLLGLALSRRKNVAALGAVLYVLNPNGYQLSAVLMPDWFNGQIMLMAVALFINWAMAGSRRSGWGASVLLPLSQMIRPTLFLLIGPMVLLLWKGFFAPGRRMLNVVLCSSVLVYPAINMAVNYRLYGVPNLLLSSGYQLHHCYVSYVRAIQRNAESPQSMTYLYFDEKHTRQLADPREIATDPYGTSPIKSDFKIYYAGFVESSKAFLHANFGLWVQAGLDGIRQQLFYPPRLNPIPDPEAMDGFREIMLLEPVDRGRRGTRLYPDLDSPMRKIHTLALFFTLCGVMLSIRRLPVGVTLFYAGCTAIIAMACTAAWYDSVRVRLLVDVIYTPILAVGLLSLPAWLCFASLSVFAYGPRKLFHWPQTYMVVASTLITFFSALFLLRRSGPEKNKLPTGAPDPL